MLQASGHSYPHNPLLSPFSLMQYHTVFSLPQLCYRPVIAVLSGVVSSLNHQPPKTPHVAKENCTLALPTYWILCQNPFHLKTQTQYIKAPTWWDRIFILELSSPRLVLSVPGSPGRSQLPSRCFPPMRPRCGSIRRRWIPVLQTLESGREVDFLSDEPLSWLLKAIPFLRCA